MIEAREACIHHWMVESPNGEISKGTCKLCGTEQSFYNTMEYMRETGTHTQLVMNKGSWADRQRQAKLAKVNG